MTVFDGAVNAIIVIGIAVGLVVLVMMLKELFRTEASMSWQELAPGRRTRCAGPHVDAAARRLPRPRVRRSERARRPGLPAGRARALPRLRRRSRAESRPWTVYAFSLLAFSAVSVLGLYLLQRVQGWLPLNPTDVGGVPPALAFNTAVSFVTNTNWQNYGGESTMSHLTQMAGLAVQNFVSAAVGIAVAIALDPRPRPARGRDDRQLLGRPHAVASPASCCRWRFVFALASAWARRGPEPHGPAEATHRRGQRRRRSRGPGRQPGGDQGARARTAAARCNANSAHPFENPSGLTNLLEMWALLAIPFALTFTFGRLAKDRRQGWAVFAAMFVLWIGAAGARDGVRGRTATPQIARRPAGTWRARRCGSARRHRASSPRPRPARRRARSSPLTTASRRSAAPCRSST